MKQSKLTGILTAAALATIAISIPAHASESKAGGKIGSLTCNAVPDSGMNLLIHSTVDVKCELKYVGSNETEHYIGETGVALGLDISNKTKQHMEFGVLAADFKKGSHQLAGKYIGAGASVTADKGVGAQVLIGGNKNSVSLEPMIEGNEGSGVSAGITYLYLQAAK